MIEIARKARVEDRFLLLVDAAYLYLIDQTLRSPKADQFKNEVGSSKELSLK